MLSFVVAVDVVCYCLLLLVGCCCSVVGGVSLLFFCNSCLLLLFLLFVCVAIVGCYVRAVAVVCVVADVAVC